MIDTAVSVANMLDAHRVLVDGDDRLENIAQIRTLEAAGYRGPYSFEPFATEVHELKDPAAAVNSSIDHISRRSDRVAVRGSLRAAFLAGD